MERGHFVTLVARIWRLARFQQPGEVGGVAVFRIGEDVKCVAQAPLDVTRAYPVHAAAARSGDGVVIFGGGVPCLSFAPVFGDSVRVVMT